ncbi:MAG: type I restriction endonuclease subunit R [Anaerovoracaceae bacterium]
MPYQSEAQLEQQLIQDLSKRNFDVVSIFDMEDLISNFRREFCRLNADKLKNELSDKEFERIMLELDGKSVFQSAKILRDKLLLTRDDKSEVYLELYDTKNNERNHFQVTNQVTVKNKYTNRYDVTILLNGLPIIQIELKRRGMDIKQAFNQIERYRKHSYHGLFRYVQMYVISNGVDTKYFANTDAKPLYSQTFFWTDDVNKRITTLSEFSKVFLDTLHITKMISRYMVVNDTEKALMVMRPYQVYATEALVKTALETANNGYIWHTTGSGKTLTSFKCSQILAKEQRIKKVIFVLDRNDLDTQTTQEFNKFEVGSVDNTDNTAALVKQIKDDGRHLIVTTIQKLSKAVNNPKYQSSLDIYKDEKVVFIFDECHRSTFGEQLKDILKQFQKAQIFGFTGTPRFTINKSQDGRTTADIFGKCLHSYLIKEAILDNNVLGFSVDYFQTFKGQFDYNDETKVKGIDTDEVFNSEEHRSYVANHIVLHHNAKTRNRQYTALFAVASIEGLIAYYDLFKKIGTELKVAAIFSFGANEESEGTDEHSRDSLERIIYDYNKTFGTRYSTDSYSGYAADLSKKIKTAQVDIVIVVGMLLTGFDSRPLNTLYVDKKLEYHNLIQAYSRTNRVEQVTKPFGNIVCYRNLKENTDTAIKLFSQTDDVDTVLMKDYHYYLELFDNQIGELFKLAPTPDMVDELKSEDEKKAFVIAFRELSKILLVLNTFVDFDFETSINSIELQYFEDYRSKYFMLYEETKNEDSYDKVSILSDLDFGIELMATDRINVAYIMNLIRNIDTADKQKQAKEVEHIRKEMGRSDSLELRRKVELIEKFLDSILPTLTVSDSVDDAFDHFESIERAAEIENFAKENSITKEFLISEIEEYEFSNIIRKKEIMDSIERPFLEKSKLVTKVIDFIMNTVRKYQ